MPEDSTSARSGRRCPRPGPDVATEWSQRGSTSLRPIPRRPIRRRSEGVSATPSRRDPSLLAPVRSGSWGQSGSDRFAGWMLRVLDRWPKNPHAEARDRSATRGEVILTSTAGGVLISPGCIRRPTPARETNRLGRRRGNHLPVAVSGPKLPDIGIHDEMVDVDRGDHQQHAFRRPESE